MGVGILIFVLVLANAIPVLIRGGAWPGSVYYGLTAMAGIWSGALIAVAIAYGGGCVIVCDDPAEAVLGALALFAALLVIGLLLRRRAR